MRLPPLLFVLLVAGCAPHRASTRQAMCADTDCYQVGPLGAQWQLIEQGDGRLGFFDASSGGVILSNITCRDDAEATPLSSLTAHMLVGYSDRQERSREVLPLFHREALRSVVDAKLDGIPVVLDLYVFKSNGCIFDLSYVAPPAAYPSGLADFGRFVEGFLQLPRTTA